MPDLRNHLPVRLVRKKESQRGRIACNIPFERSQIFHDLIVGRQVQPVVPVHTRIGDQAPQSCRNGAAQ